MSDKGGFRVSQDFAILEPKSGPAFPIPCDEWQLLKGKLTAISEPPWVLQTCASLFAGVTLATLVSLLTGTVPAISVEHPSALIVAWAVVVVSAVLAIAFFGLCREQRRMEGVYVCDVIQHMELIEHPYEQGTEGEPPVSDLVITEAHYGSRDHRINVTKRLVDAIVDGKLHIYVGNQLGGDPCPNVPKDLIVRYRYKNEEREKTVAEGEDLDLPQGL